LTTAAGLEAEQRYLLHAYECLEDMHERAQRALDAGELAAGAVDSEIVRWHLARRVAALAARPPALCFGRIDYAEDAGAERYYVGRRHVEDEAGEPVVVDWRAPAAVPFYRATSADPLDLDFRRRFLIDGETLVEIFDEDFTDESGTGAAAGVPDPLLAELERARSGEMRDIVATIQAEQDVIIRAPLEETVIVQGGPGTGKTAVGLHRAAFLLFEHRLRLERDRLLVVGPNRMFLRYISAVLPSLGETAVVQRTVDELPSGAGWGTDGTGERLEARDVAALKGDVRLATVIRRALHARIQPPAADVSGLRTAFGSARLPAAAVRTQVDDLLRREVPLADGRRMLRERLLRLAARSVGGESWSGDRQADFERELRAHKDFRAAVDAMWPSLSAPPAIRALLTRADHLAQMAAGVLDDEEQAMLLGTGRRRPAGRGRWTRSDLPLLDEAHALIAGPGAVYGHVVVDEAQDLTAMELRMVARRSRDRSMTILGDLAQATGPGGQDRWEDAVSHLEAPKARLAELTLGYRVPGPVLDYANRLLPVVAPDVTASRSVRVTGDHPLVLTVSPDRLAAAVATEVASLCERFGLIGVIAPDLHRHHVAAALTAAGVDFAEAGSDRALETAVTLLPPPAAKGLEFDATVVIEPAAFAGAAGDAAGLRLLYIALTRAVQHLSIVHAAELPAALRA
jgi:DNA helicase IV